MKKLIATFLVIASSQFVFAQHQSLDWSNMKPEKRKEVIQKMGPAERISLLKEFREKMMISELNISPSNEAEFMKVYSEYHEKQNEIKSKFQGNTDYDNMSEEEATNQLHQSFDVGQQLLDNRKIYAQKFTKIISAQQVLKMYQTEGKMRNKILDKKHDGLRNYNSQRRR
jgi:uncharacterized protein YdcH (DUF465 family)